MQHQKLKFLIAGALILSSCLLSSCSKGTPSPTLSQTPSSASTPFSGQSFKSSDVHLSGTPFYDKEINGKVKPNETSYLLLSAKDPKKAMLVVEVDLKADDLAKRSSRPVEVLGKIKWLELPEALSYSKDKLGIELSVDDKGRVAVLYVQPPGAHPLELEQQNK